MDKNTENISHPLKVTIPENAKALITCDINDFNSRTNYDLSGGTASYIDNKYQYQFIDGYYDVFASHDCSDEWNTNSIYYPDPWDMYKYKFEYVWDENEYTNVACMNLYSYDSYCDVDMEVQNSPNINAVQSELRFDYRLPYNTKIEVYQNDEFISETDMEDEYSYNTAFITLYNGVNYGDKFTFRFITRDGSYTDAKAYIKNISFESYIPDTMQMNFRYKPNKDTGLIPTKDIKEGRFVLDINGYNLNNNSYTSTYIELCPDTLFYPYNTIKIDEIREYPEITLDKMYIRVCAKRENTLYKSAVSDFTLYTYEEEQKTPTLITKTISEILLCNYFQKANTSNGTFTATSDILNFFLERKRQYNCPIREICIKIEGASSQAYTSGTVYARFLDESRELIKEEEIGIPTTTNREIWLSTNFNYRYLQIYAKDLNTNSSGLARYIKVTLTAIKVTEEENFDISVFNWATPSSLEPSLESSLEGEYRQAEISPLTLESRTTYMNNLPVNSVKIDTNLSGTTIIPIKLPSELNLSRIRYFYPTHFTSTDVDIESIKLIGYNRNNDVVYEDITTTTASSAQTFPDAGDDAVVYLEVIIYHSKALGTINVKKEAIGVNIGTDEYKMSSISAKVESEISYGHPDAMIFRNILKGEDGYEDNNSGNEFRNKKAVFIEETDGLELYYYDDFSVVKVDRYDMYKMAKGRAEALVVDTKGEEPTYIKSLSLKKQTLPMELVKRFDVARVKAVKDAITSINESDILYKHNLKIEDNALVSANKPLSFSENFLEDTFKLDFTEDIRVGLYADIDRCFMPGFYNAGGINGKSYQDSFVAYHIFKSENAKMRFTTKHTSNNFYGRIYINDVLKYERKASDSSLNTYEIDLSDVPKNELCKIRFDIKKTTTSTYTAGYMLITDITIEDEYIKGCAVAGFETKEMLIVNDSFLETKKVILKALSNTSDDVDLSFKYSIDKGKTWIDIDIDDDKHYTDEKYIAIRVMYSPKTQEQSFSTNLPTCLLTTESKEKKVSISLDTTRKTSNTVAILSDTSRSIVPNYSFKLDYDYLVANPNAFNMSRALVNHTDKTFSFDAYNVEQVASHTMTKSSTPHNIEYHFVFPYNDDNKEQDISAFTFSSEYDSWSGKNINYGAISLPELHRVYGMIIVKGLDKSKSHTMKFKIKVATVGDLENGEADFVFVGTDSTVGDPQLINCTNEYKDVSVTMSNDDIWDDGTCRVYLNYNNFHFGNFVDVEIRLGDVTVESFVGHGLDIIFQSATPVDTKAIKKYGANLNWISTQTDKVTKTVGFSTTKASNVYKSNIVMFGDIDGINGKNRSLSVPGEIDYILEEGFALDSNCPDKAYLTIKISRPADLSQEVNFESLEILGTDTHISRANMSLDTLRESKKDVAIEFDTKKLAIVNYDIQTDTKRDVVKRHFIELVADLTKKVVVKDISKIESIRNTVKDYSLVADTKRDVLKTKVAKNISMKSGILDEYYINVSSTTSSTGINSIPTKTFTITLRPDATGYTLLDKTDYSTNKLKLNAKLILDGKAITKNISTNETTFRLTYSVDNKSYKDFDFNTSTIELLPDSKRVTLKVEGRTTEFSGTGALKAIVAPDCLNITESESNDTEFIYWGHETQNMLDTTSKTSINGMSCFVYKYNLKDLPNKFVLCPVHYYAMNLYIVTTSKDGTITYHKKPTELLFDKDILEPTISVYVPVKGNYKGLYAKRLKNSVSITIDTSRKVYSGSKLDISIDTTRKLAITNSNIHDTTRHSHKSLTNLLDTKKQAIKNANTLSDTKKLAIVNYDIQIDLSRRVIFVLAITLMLNTLRKLHLSKVSFIDTKRKVLLSVFNLKHFDTLRIMHSVFDKVMDTLKVTNRSVATPFDTKKLLVKNLNIKTDTLKQVYKASNKAFDTDRFLVLNSNVLNDTLRATTITRDLAVDTKRLVLGAGDYMSWFNTKRCVIKDTNTLFDTKKLAIVNHDTKIDLLRAVIFKTGPIVKKLDTKRLIILNTDTYSDLFRFLVHDTHKTYDTFREVYFKVNVINGYDTLRALIKEDNIVTDSKRFLVEKATNISDTSRNIFLSVDNNIDTFRALVANYNIKIDTDRLPFIFINNLYDAKREQVYLKPVYKYDTLREVYIVNMTYLYADTLRAITKDIDKEPITFNISITDTLFFDIKL